MKGVKRAACRISRSCSGSVPPSAYEVVEPSVVTLARMLAASVSTCHSPDSWFICANLFYQQLDTLRSLRHEVRRDLLAESKNHKATKLLCQIPSIGPIRAALLIALIQTPHRFRTKRPFWKYSGFAIETHSSADYRSVEGQLQKSNKRISVRGLNRDCNHDLKNLFKSAATVASVKPGPFQEFYAALVAKGMRPEMARLTLARKIAAIVLIVWKKGVCFDAQYLKPQTA